MSKRSTRYRPDVLRAAADELERLRSRVKEQEDVIERLNSENVEAMKRLDWVKERLTETMAERDGYRDRAAELADENVDLASRNEALRNQLAAAEGQTNTWPTEEQLSPEMRARLMPEGANQDDLAALGLIARIAAVAMNGGEDKDKTIEVTELAEALERRLMPEGMEWPRFEDGEPVGCGDCVLDDEGRAFVIQRD